MRLLPVIVVFLFFSRAVAQDSSYHFENKAVTLKEVVVRSNLNAAAFIRRVKEDTTFHKAFMNLKVLGYQSINDIRMFNKKGQPEASLNSKTLQHVEDGCRWTTVLEEQLSGNIRSYYTTQMYSGIFFAPSKICGETNIVAGSHFSLAGKKGMARHKEQLKMLFFNPGKRIPGLPFIGNKVALFDKNVAENYDFIIDMGEFRGEMCYIFKMLPLQGRESDVVINEMTTWFNTKNWEIVGRNYDLSYNAGVYDFDVHIEVEMTKIGDYLVPKVMRYNGNWDLMFKKRERGVFTATLYDFVMPAH